MKIAIYSGEIPSTTFIEHLIKGVVKEGHQVFLFGRLKGKVSYDKDVKVVNTPSNAFYRVLFVTLYGLRFLLKNYRENTLLKAVMVEQGHTRIRQKIMFLSKVLPVLNNRPDIFHVQWIKNGIEWDFLPRFGVKLIGSFRGSHITYTPVVEPEYAKRYKESFSNFTAFHAVSRDIARKASNFGADLSKVHVIPGAVSRSLLKQPFSVKRKTTEVKIISVGRFHWVKGYQYALDACKYMKDAGIEFTYTIVGGVGQEEIPFQRNHLGLEKEVFFIDQLPHHKLLELFKAADLCLLPSIEEGIANVVLEAMAMGVPVISTDCGGMREVITHKENGWLVPIRDSKAICEAVKDYLNTDEKELMKILDNARKTIQQKHLLQNQIAAVIKMYQHTLNGAESH